MAGLQKVFGGGDFEGGEDQRDKFWNFFVSHGAKAKGASDSQVAHSEKCSLKVEVEKGNKVEWHVHILPYHSTMRSKSKGRE